VVIDAVDELIDVCEAYIVDHIMLLRALANGGDPDSYRHAMTAHLDQLVTAVQRARAERPLDRHGDPGE
jgi:DNA-binding GntR family transcriptional regulator